MCSKAAGLAGKIRSKEMRLAVLFFLSLAPLGQAGSPDYFVPAHRVSGIGVARDDISDDLLDVRTDLMIQSQTFGILSNTAGDQINSPRQMQLAAKLYF